MEEHGDEERAAYGDNERRTAAPPALDAPAPSGGDGEGGVEEKNEENEYGLQDLEKLPLLEQVHRLFHAIQMKYPYKETRAWRSLPVDQKKKMLEYIRDKRMRKAAAVARVHQPSPPATSSTSTEATAPTSAAEVAPDAPKQAAPSAAVVRTDPYLQMLQRRTLTTTTTTATAASAPSSTPLPLSGTLGLAAHPNSAYIAPAQISQYTERKNHKARWKVVDSEFYDEKCSACGIVHKEFEGAKGVLLSTMGAMMSTFGDFAKPCALAVQEVKHLVGEYLRTALSKIDPDELNAGAGLRTLVEVFHEEATYYGRWREFRGESKHEQNELEDVEEEELAEELDLFAVSEADSVFNEAFLERIKFADERTKAMDWSIYDMFARGRKLNFMSSKGQQFRHWLHLGKKLSRASLEFMNFVAYHNIGCLVETAIKHRNGGVLQAMTSPLVKDDIQAVAATFVPLVQTPIHDELPPPATKVRRVSTHVGDVTITERVVSSTSASSESAANTESPSSPERSQRTAATTVATSSSEELHPEPCNKQEHFLGDQCAPQRRSLFPLYSLPFTLIEFFVRGDLGFAESLEEPKLHGELLFGEHPLGKVHSAHAAARVQLHADRVDIAGPIRVVGQLGEIELQLVPATSVERQGQQRDQRVHDRRCLERGRAEAADLLPRIAHLHLNRHLVRLQMLHEQHEVLQADVQRRVPVDCFSLIMRILLVYRRTLQDVGRANTHGTPDPRLADARVGCELDHRRLDLVVQHARDAATRRLLLLLPELQRLVPGHASVRLYISAAYTYSRERNTHTDAPDAVEQRDQSRLIRLREHLRSKMQLFAANEMLLPNAIPVSKGQIATPEQRRDACK